MHQVIASIDHRKCHASHTAQEVAGRKSEPRSDALFVAPLLPSVTAFCRRLSMSRLRSQLKICRHLPTLLDLHIVLGKHSSSTTALPRVPVPLHTAAGDAGRWWHTCAC